MIVSCEDRFFAFPCTLNDFKSLLVLELGKYFFLGESFLKYMGFYLEEFLEFVKVSIDRVVDNDRTKKITQVKAKFIEKEVHDSGIAKYPSFGLHIHFDSFE